MNKIILLGRLTRDPEIRIGQNGSKVVRFTIAVPRKYAKEGEERLTDFFNVVTFGKQAEFAENYFSKGLQIAVIGRAELNQYEDNGVTKYSFQVVSEELNFADGKKDSHNEENNFDDLYENVVERKSDDSLPF